RVGTYVRRKEIQNGNRNQTLLFLNGPSPPGREPAQSCGRQVWCEAKNQNRQPWRPFGSCEREAGFWIQKRGNHSAGCCTACQNTGRSGLKLKPPLSTSGGRAS